MVTYSGSVTECASQRTFYAGGEILKLWQNPSSTTQNEGLSTRMNGRRPDTKANYPKEYYKENPDGSIDVRMTLYFRPQSYFYIGLIISGITFVGLLGYLGYSWIRERRRKSSDA